MKKPVNLLILGAGSVGGYVGGLLWRHSKDLEIKFIARGKHLEAIKENGLIIRSEEEHFVVPADKFGSVDENLASPDILLVCTKSFDAIDAVDAVSHLLNPETIILPLCNGIEVTERLRNFYPDNVVTNGCVYVNTRITQPGEITNFGNIQKLVFGIDWMKFDKLQTFADAVAAAGIEVCYPDKVTPAIWEKFIFISVASTASAYKNCNLGDLNKPQNRIFVNGLLDEIIKLGHKLNIDLHEKIKHNILNRISTFSGSKLRTSMHDDLIAGKPKNEVETLCGWVVKACKELKIASPNYEKAYKILISPGKKYPRPFTA